MPPPHGTSCGSSTSNATRRSQTEWGWETFAAGPSQRSGRGWGQVDLAWLAARTCDGVCVGKGLKSVRFVPLRVRESCPAIEFRGLSEISGV
jgi:hypothetical protein